MAKKIERHEYERHSLTDEDVQVGPFALFKEWWQEAILAQVPELDAAHLATVDINNHPNGRMVLIKVFDNTGLVFYTNYQSVKSSELLKNPHAAITIFWPSLERQIRIRGQVSRTSQKESADYFKTRPEGAQIGAWASPQSAIIKNRDELDNNFNRFVEKFKDRPIPCPPHWGGFRLAPVYFEYWQGRPNRLHDRIAFTLTKAGSWHVSRLAP